VASDGGTFLFKLPPANYYGSENGKVVYDIFRKRLLGVPERRAMVVSFPERRPLDAAFFAASLVRIGRELAAGGYGERGLLLHGMDADAVFNLEAAISGKASSAAFLLIDQRGLWRLVGHLAETHAQTLRLISRAVKLSATELAEREGLALNAANNRLKRLYETRLVWREGVPQPRGVSYAYHFWRWGQTPRDSL
jgi:DNA-binding transcriptional ArsR family regulator